MDLGDKTQALAAALKRPAEISLVVLAGEPGSGGEVLLAAALERLREQGFCFAARRLDLVDYEAAGERGDGFELLVSRELQVPLILEIADLPAIPAPLLASLLEAAAAPTLVLVAHCRAAEIRDRPLLRLPAATSFIELAAPSPAELAAQAGAQVWPLLRGRGAAPGERANLARFLALAGICGPAIAADPIFDLLELFGEERQAFVDRLDQTLVDGGWLEDLEYSHPLFPHILVYRFSGPVAAAVARQALEPEDLAALGNAAFEFFRVLFARGGRGAHRLLLEMATWLDRPERKRLLRTLAFWCAENEADALRGLVDASLAAGSLTAGELWETIEETAPLWTGARRLALLDSYRAAVGPSERSWTELTAARAAVLVDLRRWPEARTEALLVLTGPGAEGPHRIYLEASCRAVVGLAELDDERQADERLGEARRHLVAALESVTATERRADPRLNQQVAEMAAFFGAADVPAARAALAALLSTCRHWSGGAARGAADLWTRLADLFRQAGNHDLERAALRRALEIGRTFAGQPDPQLATLLKHLAEAELAAADSAAAARAFEEALAIEIQLFGKGSPAVEALQNTLIDLYVRLGNAAAARGHLLAAFEARRRKYGPAVPEAMVPAKLLADVCRQLGDHEGAVTALLAALEGEELLHGIGHPALIVLLKQLFDLYRELGQGEKALAVRQRLLAIEEIHFGKEDLRLLPSLKMLAILLRGRGEEEAACLLVSRAQKIEASR